MSVRGEFAGPSPTGVPAPIGVFVGSDIRLLRESIASLCERSAFVRVVGIGASATHALHAANELRPDVMLIDMAMEDGLELIRAITAVVDGSRVVAFAVGDSDVHVLACLEAGAVGYVPRDATAEELVASLVSAGRGETLCSPRVVTSLCRRLAKLSRSAGPTLGALQLTQREREVGLLIERGLSNKEIAVRLGIELATVKNHVHNILEKLHVRRRAEAGARLRERAANHEEQSIA